MTSLIPDSFSFNFHKAQQQTQKQQKDCMPFDQLSSSKHLQNINGAAPVQDYLIKDLWPCAFFGNCLH